MSDPFRILALSGGGYQGLFTAQVLAAIEAAGPGRLRDRFDLIAGTSIGGIIALALAAGVPAARIVETFLEAGPVLFPNGPVRGGRRSAARDALRFLTRPKYDPAPLRDLLRALPSPDLRLSDLPVDVLIPATRVSDGDPVLFSRGRHGRFRLIDVALATSAAPLIRKRGKPRTSVRGRVRPGPEGIDLSGGEIEGANAQGILRRHAKGRSDGALRLDRPLVSA